MTYNRISNTLGLFSLGASFAVVAFNCGHSVPLNTILQVNAVVIPVFVAFGIAAQEVIRNFRWGDFPLVLLTLTFVTSLVGAYIGIGAAKGFGWINSTTKGSSIFLAGMCGLASIVMLARIYDNIFHNANHQFWPNSIIYSNGRFFFA